MDNQFSQPPNLQSKRLLSPNNGTGTRLPPLNSFQPSGSNGDKSSLCWWLAAASMALTLTGAIFVLVHMLTDDGASQPASKDTQLQVDDDTSGGNPEPSTDLGTASSISSTTESNDQARYGEDILPELSINQADYVLLDGYQLLPSDEYPCWSTSYRVAFKGDWNNQLLDATFDQDSLFTTIERETKEAYPDVVVKDGHFIHIRVYQFNGSQELRDYYDNDYKLYSRGNCS